MYGSAPFSSIQRSTSASPSLAIEWSGVLPAADEALMSAPALRRRSAVWRKRSRWSSEFALDAAMRSGVLLNLSLRAA